jgi:magnesium-transporting ATPase (P-type)
MFDSATQQPSPAIAAPGTGAPWHIAAAEDVLAQVDSSPSGLTPEQATARLSAHGPNELREAERISWLRILLAQFNSLIIWILIAAGIVSGVLGDAWMPSRSSPSLSSTPSSGSIRSSARRSPSRR